MSIGQRKSEIVWKLRELPENISHFSAAMNPTGSPGGKILLMAQILPFEPWCVIKMGQWLQPLKDLVVANAIPVQNGPACGAIDAVTLQVMHVNLKMH